MTYYEKRREHNKRRNLEPKYIIEQTSISTWKFLLGGLITWGPLIFVGLLIERTQNFSYLYVVLGFYLLESILVFNNGGNGIGHLILGIRYVDTSTFKLYKGKDYRKYYFDSWWDRFKLHDTYEVFSKIFSPTFQTKIMREHKIMLCDRKAHKMFIEDYFENGRLKKEFMKLTKREKETFLGISNKPIFKD